MYVINKCPVCDNEKNKILYSIKINEQLEISKVIDSILYRFSNDELSLMYSKEVDYE